MELTNQKEYLKKYLPRNITDRKRKKKKKPEVTDSRVTIIDDDIDISKLQTAEEAIDLFNTNEDAPQVVGVIDERPVHLRVKDYTDSVLWKPVGEQIETPVENSAIKTSFQITKKPSNTLIQFNYNDKKSSIKNQKNDRILKQNKHYPSVNEVSSDQSPPRRSQITEDVSPPRRNVKQMMDSSPPRKSQVTDDSSPPRRGPKNTNDRDKHTFIDEDRSRKTNLKDSSPPRRHLKDSSPPRKVPKGIDNNTRDFKRKHSPPRRDRKPFLHKNNGPSEIKRHANRMNFPEEVTEKYIIPAKRKERMTKTLDGKTAGLQNAQELVKETAEFKKRENELFNNMDANVSGANATTIVRDRKTGRIRDFAKEAEESKEKEKREKETQEKYMQWGKGLKQVESYQEKLAQDLHEMNKPLARYADDEDLEKFLKERERDEDPMLQYIRRKKKKKQVETGKPSKPEYMGEFMPNRYGIVPGHRWDGVDRSNGYEQRWLETQNAKLAVQEDIYKWSTEDM